MAENQKPTDDMEELSRLLDAINSGQQPTSDDKETAELLAVAALLKETAGPVRPPQHILDQTVTRAMAGLEAGKPKRFRPWLYSGALGTAAAAVLLAIGLNLFPVGQSTTPPVLPPVSGPDLRATPQELPAKEKAPIVAQTPTGEQAPLPNTTAKSVSPAPERPIAGGETPRTETAQPQPVEQSKPPTIAKNAPLMAERAPMFNKSSKAADIAAELPKRPSAIPVLSLPGQTPNLVITDQDSGTVRQVYNKGTPQEIIITQRIPAKDAVRAQAQEPPPEETKTAPGALNKITVTIQGQEITIEGHQTRQELLQLAESLTP